jgi:hypothetical protein
VPLAGKDAGRDFYFPVWFLPLLQVLVYIPLKKSAACELKSTGVDLRKGTQRVKKFQRQPGRTIWWPTYAIQELRHFLSEPALFKARTKEWLYRLAG